MLEFYSLETSHSWREYLNHFDPFKQTYVVSDLRSKFEIQQILLSQYGVLPELAVLRASELWSLLFKSVYPEKQVIGRALATSLIGTWLKEESDEMRTPGVPKTLAGYLEHLAPLLTSEGSEEVVVPWLQERPESMIRWGKWYFLAKKYADRFLNENLVLNSWISSFLSKASGNFSWKRNLVFDLGGQLTPVETLLIQDLSASTNTVVLKPSDIHLQSTPEMFEIYNLMEGQGDSFSSSIHPIRFDENQVGGIRRFSTMVTEIKDVCGQVKCWLEQGLQPSQIAVVSPNLELYWPVLNMYFEREGIPVQKKLLTRKLSFPQVQAWMSRMRVETQKLNSSDLETVLFRAQQEPPGVPFSQFERSYKNIYNDSDLFRLKEVSKQVRKSSATKDNLHYIDFFKWALKMWEGDDSLIEDVLKALFAECPHSVKMGLDEWITYLAQSMAQAEVSYEESKHQGVFCESPKSARYLNVKAIYFLGLNRNNTVNRKTTSLTTEDVLALRKDLGFYLENTENELIVEEVDWVSRQENFQKVFSTSETHFTGEPEVPSNYWVLLSINNNRPPQKVDLPMATRWDFEQRLRGENLQTALRWEDSQFSSVVEHVDNDLGKGTRAKIDPKFLDSLSVSRLQNYAKCPFIFSAGSLFSLDDRPSIDIGVDPMSKGSLYHKIFETITEEPMRFDYSEDELMQLIESCRKEEKISVGSLEHWQLVQKSYLEVTKNFISFEKAWRDKFPKLRVLGREVELKASWDRTKKKFVKAGEGEIQFKGYIDRIDTDQNRHAVVIDYKSSEGQTSNYTSWINKKELQLAVYSYLIAEGLTSVDPHEVWGACYYIIKNCQRQKGFWRADVESHLFAVNSRARNKLSKDEQTKFFEQVLHTLDELIENVFAGDFSPQPQDIKNCFSCRWRKMCRAPHLN